MTTADAVVLRDVVVCREGAVLLDGVDLRVGRGERWALLGPNGAGKTTLLDLAGARAHPTRGQVHVLGRRLGAVDVRELWPRVALVRTTHRPAGRLTARQVVLTGASGTAALPMRWKPGPALVAQAGEALATLGAGPLADRAWTALSTGEQRRVLLARALLGAPELLLLDEPATGLDLPARERLVASLEALPATLTTVLVTHHLEELPATTTHALLLRAGAVVVAGPVAQVLTDGPVSTCFDLPLRVRRDDGRWSARRA